MSRLLVHDVAKILYSDEGYLPYYPYHMISDEEMIDAFVKSDSCFFNDFYPLPSDTFETEYNDLKSYITKCCDKYLLDGTAIPDWVYSYMLGKVVGPLSDQKDVHDLFVLLNLDNLYDEFNEGIYSSILSISNKVIGTYFVKSHSSEVEYRPATMFGEPHVIKYLRLEQVSVRP